MTKTITKAFVDFLEDRGVATFGVDLFANQVPQGSPDECYWVTSRGGNPINRLSTGEIVRQYFITVNFRSVNADIVDVKLHELSEIIDEPECVQLDGFKVYSNPAVTQYPADQDLDSIDRSVGLIQVSLQIYKTYKPV